MEVNTGASVGTDGDLLVGNPHFSTICFNPYLPTVIAEY